MIGALRQQKSQSKEITTRVWAELRRSLGQLKGKRCTVMFSGGFDSVLMATLAVQYGAKVTAVTIQFEQYNPNTVRDACRVAKQLGITHRIIAVDVKAYMRSFEAMAVMDAPVFDLDLPVVHAALMQYRTRTAGRVIISGMGSDQWWGNEANVDADKSVQARMDNAKRSNDAHQLVAKEFGLDFVFPFLTKSMIALSLTVPKGMKKDKKILRSLAMDTIHIPSQGSYREVQVPDIVRRMLIKVYGHRAWPLPIPLDQRNSATDQILRQIVLGLWLEKAKVGSKARDDGLFAVV